jgi:hypothetical protein
MAAISDHEAFRQPADSEGILWRYMDLPKLVSLLSKSELYLVQLASLEDTWEGKFPPAVRQALIAFYDSNAWNQGRSRSAIPPQFNPADWMSTEIRKTAYVNCWCMQKHESAAMWQIYGGTSGVAIRTQYRLLRDALPSSVFIGQVQYIDPETTEFPHGNALNLIMHKRHFFRHEEECRVVKWNAEKKDFLSLDQTRMGISNYPYGERLSIDLTKAIQDVVVSPLAPKWYKDCVDAIVGSFAPRLQVCASKMMG